MSARQVFEDSDTKRQFFSGLTNHYYSSLLTPLPSVFSELNDDLCSFNLLSLVLFPGPPVVFTILVQRSIFFQNFNSFRLARIAGNMLGSVSFSPRLYKGCMCACDCRNVIGMGKMQLPFPTPCSLSSIILNHLKVHQPVSPQARGGDDGLFQITYQATYFFFFRLTFCCCCCLVKK